MSNSDPSGEFLLTAALIVIGGGAIIGGIMGGISAEAEGGSFWKGFWEGSLIGGVSA